MRAPIDEQPRSAAAAVAHHVFTACACPLMRAGKVAADAPDGSNILCMIPDTAERYLSTPLFENIAADMNDAELALSESTPGYQL